MFKPHRTRARKRENHRQNSQP